MSDVDFAQVLSYVATKSTETEVRAIFEVANARARALRSASAAENLASLQPGQPVRLRNLKPKYLNGLRGTVEGILGARVRIKLSDTDAITAGRYARFDHTLDAPASAVELVE